MSKKVKPLEIPGTLNLDLGLVNNTHNAHSQGNIQKIKSPLTV